MILSLNLAMVADWFYPFSTLYAGTLVKRYKRFFADIQLDTGELITAHCPNTGPMTGICHIGGAVMVSHNPSPKRKLAYTWELAAINDTVPTWAGANTALPNRVVRSLLESRILPELGPYTTIQTEVPYGQGHRSRIDFLVSGAAVPPTYIEVKNTTWAQGQVALFPDTVTSRGQKHLQELIDLGAQGRGVMLYFINRGDCTAFAPGDQADPTYGQLLRAAIAAGVQVLPCRFEVTPQGIRYLGLASLAL